jgi:hypothetical protein
MHHIPLITLIKAARKAQQSHNQKHDTQLEIPSWDRPLGNSSDGLWRKEENADDKEDAESPLSEWTPSLLPFPRFLEGEELPSDNESSRT